MKDDSAALVVGQPVFGPRFICSPLPAEAHAIIPGKEVDDSVAARLC